MPTRAKLDELTNKLQQAWKDANDQIDAQIEEQTNRAKLGFTKEQRQVSAREAIVIAEKGREAEAIERARAITESVVSELLEEIESLQGALADLRTRIQVLELRNGIGTGFST